jgi:hypothetical protein
LQIADCRLQIADCRLQIADCRLQIADCRLQIADCRLQIADLRSGRVYSIINLHFFALVQFSPVLAAVATSTTHDLTGFDPSSGDRLHGWFFSAGEGHGGYVR